MYIYKYRDFSYLLRLFYNIAVMIFLKIYYVKYICISSAIISRNHLKKYSLAIQNMKSIARAKQWSIHTK